MGFFIVQQLVKPTPDSDVYPDDVKTVSCFPTINEAGERVFQRMPYVTRVYIGNTNWNSPAVIPSFEEFQAGAPVPTVWTITANPRTGLFNWHNSYGQEKKEFPNPRFGTPLFEKRKIVAIKPESGTASTIVDKLSSRLGRELAEHVVGLLLAEIDIMEQKKAKAAMKKASKRKTA